MATGSTVPRHPSAEGERLRYRGKNAATTSPLEVEFRHQTMTSSVVQFAARVFKIVKNV
jgi:hypothetical protein